MIGGVIVGPGGGVDAAVVVRAIGPSLADFGVADPLLDPVPELRDVNGDLIAMNDNWDSDPEPDNYPSSDAAACLKRRQEPPFRQSRQRLTRHWSAKMHDRRGLVEVYHVAAQRPTVQPLETTSFE